MKANSFRFRLGNFECLVAKDGVLKGPFDESMDLSCILIQTGTHTVLIDTGFGAALQPQLGNLVTNLKEAGVSTSEIDTVLISHAHPDHICGITGPDQKPIFAQARHFISKQEWETRVSRADFNDLSGWVKTETTAAINKNLLPLQGKINLMERPGEVVPGIRFIPAPGHAPGHSIFLVSSESQQLLCICDLLHDPLEFTQPDIYRKTHWDADLADRSLSQVFSDVLKPEMLVFAGHFPFPGVGHIVKPNGLWQWKPV